MSFGGNIHGIGDYQDNQPAQAGGPAGGYEEDPRIGIGLTPPSAMGMIPSISERLMPRFKVKTATFFLGMLEVLVFISTLVFAGVTEGRVFVEGNAMAGPSGNVLKEMGGKYYPCIREGEVWRLVTSIFLHAGIIHLFSNLFFQFYFGFTFEKRWGTVRFVALYLITGIGAALLSSVASPVDVSVGASGALFGLFGADMIYLFMNWDDIPQNKAEACVLTFVTLINFILGFSSGAGDSSGPKKGQVDNFAHLGGLITGVFSGAILCPPLNIHPKTKLYQSIGTILWMVFFVTLILIMFLQNLAPLAPC